MKTWWYKATYSWVLSGRTYDSCGSVDAAAASDVIADLIADDSHHGAYIVTAMVWAMDGGDVAKEPSAMLNPDALNAASTNRYRANSGNTLPVPVKAEPNTDVRLDLKNVPWATDVRLATDTYPTINFKEN